ncbi:low affinity immunoglobulin epsilon Fc receptor-like isoform X2 [Rhineura floridana]|uniref:low affinity immunoglobulin epsilon Fc receptor-like isoform X2 n=1 Tax=Rhineura floridana TaxID=261503 RepID=UPI002AC87DFA|nr:low affinity immunoglobulin epsilon Fc receptor-like isoform X2 [Rhineura floridana]
MAQGGIYRRCEEPENLVVKEKMMGMAPTRTGGFLWQRCRCGSDGTSISILYIVNVVSFVLWTILFAVITSKYSEMAEKLEELRGNQAALTTNGSNMEKQLEMLHSSYAIYGLRLNDSMQRLVALQDTMKKDVNECLGKMQDEGKRTLKETFKLQEALHKMNDSACRVCPEGWLLSSGQCYHFQVQNTHWSFAKKSCEDQGGHLVVINDLQEQSFLRSNTKQNNYWIGLSDMLSEGTFVWVDSSPVSFTSWNPREPNNAGQGEDCVIMTPSGRWQDRECGSDIDGYICEKTWSC